MTLKQWLVTDIHVDLWVGLNYVASCFVNIHYGETHKWYENCI